MKWLKTYNLFTESKGESEVVDWIKDSLLELVDSGYIVEVRPFSVDGGSYTNPVSFPGLAISIQSDKWGKMLPITIGDNLLTIDSYLRELGWQGYNSYDWDNPYSQSRYQVRVKASLKGIENKFETELSQFVKMLDRFQVNAPFDTIQVSYFRPKEG